MTDWWYPTAFNTWAAEEHAAAERVLASGKLTMGPQVKAFEEEFATYHGRKHGIMCNSGSSANLLMVAALIHRKDNPLKRGDKVVVPALAWSTTYAPLVQYGLDLVLCDVDASWNATPYDPQLRYADAKLIVGCSILGIPAHLAAWRVIARETGATFIEDNCESIGATDVDGTLCGTFGKMASFSFFWSHQVNGIEGGMVLTDDAELADLCRMLRAHGWTRDVQPADEFEDEYDFRVHGYNLRPLELHAAVARVQLRKLHDGVGWRYVNARAFYEAAMDAPELQPFHACKGKPSMFGIHFLLPSGTRPGVVAALRASSIDCRLPTGGSFTKHAYGAPWAAQATPETDRIHTDGLFIGNAPFDIRDKVRVAVEVARRAVDGWNGQEALSGSGLPAGHHSGACDPA